jgi:hypothetical protein
MVRKISFLILSVALLVLGALAFNKLGYWDRSVRIFRFNSDASYTGKKAIGQGARREFAGSRTHDLPDNLRRRFGAGEISPVSEKWNKDVPDSTRKTIGQGIREQSETRHFEAGIRNEADHRGGELNGTKKINLRNVLRFLSVFAFFTILALYLDKGATLIRKRNAKKADQRF